MTLRRQAATLTTLAAWRLHGHLDNDSGDIWTRAANYHSRTPYYNAVYRADLILMAAKWADRLDALLSGDATKINAALSALATPAPKTAKATIPTNTQLMPSTELNASYISRQIAVKTNNE